MKLVTAYFLRVNGLSSIKTAGVIIDVRGLDELIDFFISNTDLATSRGNQWRIEVQPLPGTVLFSFLECALNSCEDQLPGGKSLWSGRLMQVAGKIDRGSDGVGSHYLHYADAN